MVFCPERSMSFPEMRPVTFTVISVSNPVAEQPKKTGGGFVSTKENADDHGFGLKSIGSTVEKYKGEMQRIANDIKKQILERIALHEEKFETWTKGKHIEPELVREPRYRRLMPFSDSEIDGHLKKYKEIIKG